MDPPAIPHPPSAIPPESPGGYRELWRVALPLIISTGSLTLMQFCDRMFLAQYSGVSIRAALPAGILSFTMICGFYALAGYANTFVAQYHGAGDRAGCARSVAQATWLALLSWPLVLMLIPAGWWILRISGHGADVLREELEYFTILMAGSLPSLLSSAVAGFFSGRGDTRTTMWAYMTGNLLNIPLDYLLIFGKGGCPELGIRGAAVATVIAGVIPAVILYTLFLSPRFHRAFETRRHFRFDGPLFRRLLRFGLPAGIQLALDLTSFTVFVLLTGRFGEVAHAASNIALSINTLAFMPMIGLGIAAGIVVGQYQGRREWRHAQRAGWTALKMGAAYMVTVGLTYLLFPAFYVSLFTGTHEGSFTVEEILPVARVLLVMLTIWGAADACDMILAGALKGAGDTRFVMWYSLAMAWGLFVAGLVVLVFVLDRGIYACWAWTTFYIIALGVGYLRRFARGRWKDIDLLGREGVEILPPPGRPGGDGLAVE